eukprot:1157922-Pelagomonas_calceolata.AAC.21
MLRLVQADMEEAHASGAASAGMEEVHASSAAYVGIVISCRQPWKRRTLAMQHLKVSAAGPGSAGHHFDRAMISAAHMLEGCWGWGYDMDSWRAHLNALTWPEGVSHKGVTDTNLCGFQRPQPRNGSGPASNLVSANEALSLVVADIFGPGPSFLPEIWPDQDRRSAFRMSRKVSVKMEQSILETEEPLSISRPSDGAGHLHLMPLVPLWNGFMRGAVGCPDLTKDMFRCCLVFSRAQGALYDKRHVLFLGCDRVKCGKAVTWSHRRSTLERCDFRPAHIACLAQHDCPCPCGCLRALQLATWLKVLYIIHRHMCKAFGSNPRHGPTGAAPISGRGDFGLSAAKAGQRAAALQRAQSQNGR